MDTSYVAMPFVTSSSAAKQRRRLPSNSPGRRLTPPALGSCPEAPGGHVGVRRCLEDVHAVLCPVRQAPGVDINAYNNNKPFETCR